MKSILDPTFRYTPSVQTDIRKTFARIRREQRTAESKNAKRIDQPPQNIVVRVSRRRPTRASPG